MTAPDPVSRRSLRARAALARRTPAAAAPTQPPYTVVGGQRRVRDGEITVMVASEQGVGEMQLLFSGGELVAGRLPGEPWKLAQLG